MNLFRRICCLFAAFCLVGGAAWAQEKPEPPKSEARLDISLSPRKNRAEVDLFVGSPRPVSVDNAVAESQVRAALREAFGDATLTRIHYSADAYDPKEDEHFNEDGEPDENYVPPPLKADSFTFWNVRLENLGAIRRDGFLQTGRFDPAPVRKLMRGVGIETFDVSLTIRGARNAPVAQCDSLLPDSVSRDSTPTQFRKSLSVSTAHPAITFAVGYRAADVWERLLPCVTVLLGAVGAFLWYRGQAVRAFDRSDALAATDEPAANRAKEAIRFGLLRVMTVGVTGLSTVWGVAYLYFKPGEPFEWAANVTKLSELLSWGVLCYSVPLFLCLTLCTALAVPVLHRADVSDAAEPITLGKVLMGAGGQFALSTLPVLLAMLAIGSFLDGGLLRFLPMWVGLGRDPAMLARMVFARSESFTWIAWAILAFLSRPLTQNWIVATGNATPFVINGGDLVARVSELAERAGVRVTQVVFLHTGRDNQANAFAVVGNILVFTDKLLKELSRREVEGVIAHELAHLRRGHPKRIGQAQLFLGWFPIVLMLYLSFTGKLPADSRLLWAVALPLSTLVATLVTRAMSRTFEKEADTDAVNITGDTEGLITGLARLGRLSGLPQDWSRLDAGLLTHPSTTRRIAYLSDAGKLSPEERDSLAARLANEKPAPADERYAAPSGTDDGTVFSPMATLRNALAVAAMMTLILAGIPNVWAHVAEAVGVSFPPVPPGYDAEQATAWRNYQIGKPNWAILLPVYIVGAATTLAAFVAYINAVGTTFYRVKEPQLRARFVETGKITPDEAARALYVAIAPGGEPRNFGGSQAWDMGYLLLGETGELRYVGEKTAFALSARQIVALDQSPDAFPGWIGVRRVRLSWQSDAGETATVLLGSGGEKTLRDLQSGMTRLLQTLTTWRESTPVNANTHPLPDWSSVSGLTPRDLAHPRFILPGMLKNVGIAVAVAILTGLPGRGIVFCALVVIAIHSAEWVKFSAHRPK